jgi:hypothetical protein
MFIAYCVWVVVATVVALSAVYGTTQGPPPPAAAGTLPNTTCFNSTNATALDCGPRGVCLQSVSGQQTCVCAPGFVDGVGVCRLSQHHTNTVVRFSLVESSDVGPVPPSWSGPCNYPLVSNVNAFLAA